MNTQTILTNNAEFEPPIAAMPAVVHVDDLQPQVPQKFYNAIVDADGNVVRISIIDDPRFAVARHYNAASSVKKAVPVSNEFAERWLAANPANGR